MTSSTRQAQRHHLLQVAIEALSSRGPQALSLRAIAQGANTSTQMIYTIFGGKDGLVLALYQEGFDRLARQLDQAAGAPCQARKRPLALSLAMAVRDFAHAQPMFYEIMFDRPVPDFEPPMADAMRRQAAYELLAHGVRASLGHDCGGADPSEVADALWQAIHGALRMELGGFYSDEAQAQARYEATIRALLRGFGVSEAASARPTRPARAGELAMELFSP